MERRVEDGPVCHFNFEEGGYMGCSSLVVWM